MPNKANVLISRQEDVCEINVEGRATFDCSPPLRHFADNIASGHFKKIQINLEKCEWMDSTFMGTLATLGLRARSSQTPIEIVNAGAQNMRLLKELGVVKLFTFSDADKAIIDTNNYRRMDTPFDQKTMAETVLDAHETLMDVDESNVQRFKAVVDMVKKDLNKP